MKNNHILLLMILFMLPLSSGSCTKDNSHHKVSHPKIEGIKAKLDEGKVWHDIDFFNESDKDLNEVKVSISLTGEKGDQKSEYRYLQFGLLGRSSTCHLM